MRFAANLLVLMLGTLITLASGSSAMDDDTDDRRHRIRGTTGAESSRPLSSVTEELRYEEDGLLHQSHRRAKKKRVSKCSPSKGKKAKKINGKKNQAYLDCSELHLVNDNDDDESVEEDYYEDVELHLMPVDEGADPVVTGEVFVSFHDLIKKDVDYEPFVSWSAFNEQGDYFQLIKHNGNVINGFVQHHSGVAYSFANGHGDDEDEGEVSVIQTIDFEDEHEALPPPKGDVVNPEEYNEEELQFWSSRNLRDQVLQYHRSLQDSSAFIDVLVLYTDETYRNRCGFNVNTCEAKIAEMVTWCNNAFDNSGINTQIRLAGTPRRITSSEYAEPNTNNLNGWREMLEDLTFTSTAPLNFVQTLRNDRNADMVAMIVDLGGFCGLAWTNENPVSSDEAFAYSVTYFDCTSSFAHELGHNWGLRHNRENCNVIDSDLNYGYQAPNGIARTTLAYNCPNGGCPRLPYFSNPNIFFPNSSARTGDAQLANNAGYMNQFLSVYSNWRLSSPPTPTPPTPIPTAPPPTPTAPSPTPAPFTCPQGYWVLQLQLTTDAFGAETSFNLSDDQGNTIIERAAGSLNSFTIYTYRGCILQSTCMVFTVNDSFGDGLCCNEGLGGYEIRLDDSIVASGGEFTDEDTATFGNCDAPPPPTRSPTRFPTKSPTKSPTIPPTRSPTQAPTRSPTQAPTRSPTQVSPTRFPTKSPTKSPTIPPTRSPTQAPAMSPTNPPPTNPPPTLPTEPEDEDDGGCFPGSAMVMRLTDGGGGSSSSGSVVPVSLHDVELGDVILVSVEDDGKPKYEPVYSFGHYAPTTMGTYIQLTMADENIDNSTTTTTMTLELTPNHMVYVVEQDEMIPAFMVAIGQHVMNQYGQAVPVVSKGLNRHHQVHLQGMYAPFTPSGQLVVNGVVVSCYITFQQDGHFHLLDGRWKTPFTFHRLAHLYTVPRRLYCQFVSSTWCNSEERYTEDDGLATWVVNGFEIARWVMPRTHEQEGNEMLLLRTLVLAVLFVMLIPVGIILYFLDVLVLSSSPMSSTLLTLATATIGLLSFSCWRKLLTPIIIRKRRSTKKILCNKQD